MQGEIRGIYTPPPFYPLLGERERHDRRVRRPRRPAAQPVHVRQLPGRRDRGRSGGARGRDRRLPRRAGADAVEEWVEKEDREFDQFLTMLYVLLALSVIISLFGMVNTLVLSVFERTRELGMLRAVGMTRRQARRMIRTRASSRRSSGRSGLPLGIFLAVLVTARSRRVRRPLRGA